MITAVNQDLADTLATIAKFAADSGARVASVTVGDVSFVLAPAEPDFVAVPTKEEPPSSPLGPPAFRDPRKASP